MAVIGVAWWLWSSRSISHPDGTLVPEAPLQTAVPDGTGPFQKKDYRIIPLAQFEVHARVLSAEHYWFDREAALAPVDLALGWGRMSDTHFIEQLAISQSFRFYRYMWTGQAPLPASEIVSSSANMHMIPADDEVERALKRVRTGHIVDVKGYLVRVEAPDGWRWVSSLSRTDSGPGACEVVWAESIDVSE
jgi:hypothetical protein